MTTQVPEARPTAYKGRRRATRRAFARPIATFDSWRGVVWTVVIALDFLWFSNPYVLLPFDNALRNAAVTTLVGVVMTLPRFQIRQPSWTVVAVLCFGCTSALWSSNPHATVRYTSTFLLIAAVATVIAANVDARTLCHGIALGGVVVLGASWYAFHEQMPHADVPLGTIGFLAGVGGNRNVLAYTLVLALTFAVSFLPRRWWGRLIWLATIGALLVGIFLAQSGTGYAATLVVVAAAGALAVADVRGTRVRPARRRWSVRAAALLVVVGGVVGVELLGRALGRNTTTLSGRVPLWEAIWSSTTGADRWVGEGWGAVWPHAWISAPRSPLYSEIIDQIGYVLNHGHNSVFDLLPEVGIVGVVVYALTYVEAVTRALRLRAPGHRPTSDRLQAGRAGLLGVLVLLVYGLTEPMSTIPLGWFAISVLATGLVPTSASRATREAAPPAPVQ